MAEKPGHRGVTQRLREAFQRFTQREDVVLPDLQDAFYFGGLACVCYGVAQIYVPAAWVVGGLGLLWVGARG